LPLGEHPERKDYAAMRLGGPKQRTYQ